MISCVRGFEYYIILDKEYNYFDIIPDLEKLTKHNLSLKNKILKFIAMRDADDRLLQSNYYLEKKNEWFN